MIKLFVSLTNSMAFQVKPPMMNTLFACKTVSKPENSMVGDVKCGVNWFNDSSYIATIVFSVPETMRIDFLSIFSIDRNIFDGSLPSLALLSGDGGPVQSITRLIFSFTQKLQDKRNYLESNNNKNKHISNSIIIHSSLCSCNLTTKIYDLRIFKRLVDLFGFEEMLENA